MGQQRSPEIVRRDHRLDRIAPDPGLTYAEGLAVACLAEGAIEQLPPPIDEQEAEMLRLARAGLVKLLDAYRA